MKIGDIVHVRKEQHDFNSQKVTSKTTPAEVVYIHPKNRFYTVMFKDGTRESFKIIPEPDPADAREFGKHGSGHHCRRGGNHSRSY